MHHTPCKGATQQRQTQLRSASCKQIQCSIHRTQKYALHCTPSHTLEAVGTYSDIWCRQDTNPSVNKNIGSLCTFYTYTLQTADKHTSTSVTDRSKCLRHSAHSTSKHEKRAGPSLQACRSSQQGRTGLSVRLAVPEGLVWEVSVWAGF